MINEKVKIKYLLGNISLSNNDYIFSCHEYINTMFENNGEVLGENVYEKNIEIKLIIRIIRIFIIVWNIFYWIIS